jgi:MYXO-CTERM domain-containing protein
MRTSRKFVVVCAAVLGLLGIAAHRAQAVVNITIGTATGAPGDFVPVAVTLQTGGDQVAGTQNTIGFAEPNHVAIAADNSGSPMCTVNPDIHKSATTFAFQPAGCTVGTDCTGVKALVLSLNNVDAIPDGSTLYTCQVAISQSAGAQAYPLTNTDALASDPQGNSLDTQGIDGSVTVAGPADATIAIGSGSAPAGGSTTIDVTLTVADGVQVAGTQNTINFPTDARIVENNDGTPKCTVNSAIMKPATTFAFQPAGCTVGTNCTGVKALVLSLSNVSPIPSGSVLYSCEVGLTNTATGSYELTCSDALASDPSGNTVNTDCTKGTITVGGEATPTETATTEATPTFTPTTGGGGTPTVTRTGQSTATRTRTRTIPTPGGRVNEDDGCAIASPADTSAGWMLLFPAAALLWLRRRSR